MLNVTSLIFLSAIENGEPVPLHDDPEYDFPQEIEVPENFKDAKYAERGIFKSSNHRASDKKFVCEQCSCKGHNAICSGRRLQMFTSLINKFSTNLTRNNSK